MNTLVELLNACGVRFVNAAWPMLWQSALLMTLVFALDFILRKRVRATTRYALWLLVLAKLVVPASFSLPTGLGYWIPAPKVLVAARPDQQDAASSLRLAPSAAASTASTTSTTSTTSIKSTKSTAASSLRLDPNRPAAPTLRWRGVAVLLWLAGMAALSGVLAFRARLTRRMIAAASGTEQFSALLSQCASRLGIRRRVTLKLSAMAATPAVCGLFRPVILLPADLAGRLSAAQMEAVLLHELAHVRRGDPWVNYFQALLQIFYFYNPLLWLANSAIRRAREEAVDELVLVALADAAEVYPEMLIQVAKFSLRAARPGFGWVGILEKKSTVGGRIRLMLQRPWPKSARLGLRGGLAVAVLAAMLLPMQTRPQPQNPAPGATSSPRLDTWGDSGLSTNPPPRPRLVPSGSTEVNKLCAAIYDRHWAEASKMIDNGAAVNGVDDQRRTPLGCLVEPWYQWTSEDEAPGEALLQKLLQHGADPFAPSTTGNPNEMRTPVEIAMGCADTTLGGIMLSNNPSPDRRTLSGDDALCLAIRLSRPFGTKGMTPHLGDLQLRGQSQTRTNLIDFLLSHGFSVNRTNKDGLTLLQEMAWSPVDGPFIAASNPPPYFERTLAQDFAFDKPVARDPIIADFLLSRGAKLDVFSAAGMGLTHQLAAFLRANPKLANARDSFGRTPLHFAILSQTNTTALLLQAGADPKLQTTRSSPGSLPNWQPAFPVGCSPLHLAVTAENRAGAQLLIKAGAPLAEADADGNTPLHSTTPYRIEMQKLLLSAGAPLDLTNRAGKTPLRIAFDYGSTEDVALLLKAGARKDIGLSNTTLLHLAASPGGDWQDAKPPFMGHEARADTIPTLVSAGLAVDTRDGQGRTPFQLAVTALNLDAMGLLLTNGADINAVDPRGNTALHQLSMRPVDTVQIIQPSYRQSQRAGIAPSTTNINLTAWLLEHGANPNLTNHDGHTPLDLLRAQKWTNATQEQDAAARIALLQKAAAKGK